MSDTPQFYDPARYDPSNSVGLLIKQVMGMMRQEVDGRLSACGLSNAQWVPLYHMLRKGRTTVAEIAREHQVDAGAVTRMIDRLEAKGLCVRERSTQDRRVVELVLTPEGREAVRDVPAVLCGVQNELLHGFDQGEWQQLLGLLARLHLNAQQWTGRCDPADGQACVAAASAAEPPQDPSSPEQST